MCIYLWSRWCVNIAESVIAQDEHLSVWIKDGWAGLTNHAVTICLRHTDLCHTNTAIFTTGGTVMLSYRVKNCSKHMPLHALKQEHNIGSGVTVWRSTVHKPLKQWWPTGCFHVPSCLPQWFLFYYVHIYVVHVSLRYNRHTYAGQSDVTTYQCSE